MSNVSFTIFTTYLSKFKCQLYHIYMHVSIHLAFIYTYLLKEANLTFLPVYVVYFGVCHWMGLNSELFLLQTRGFLAGLVSMVKLGLCHFCFWYVQLVC